VGRNKDFGDPITGAPDPSWLLAIGSPDGTQSGHVSIANTGMPRVLKFPFAYNTPNLLTGAAVYTPTAGDLLLDAWVEVDTAWNGTTPLCDYGTFVANSGWLAQGAQGAFDIGAADAQNAFFATGGNLLSGSPVPSDDLYASAHQGPANTYGAQRALPAKFVAATAVKVCVSQDGKDNGADPGSTQGAAILYLVVCTPTAG